MSTERPTLGSYLRARREQVRPADVGLPDTGRRRTPGLRREEVAALAGVSIDYLIRLEQGRDTNPSAAVLRALADALQLTPDERHHLLLLAKVEASPESCPASTPPIGEVSRGLRAVLEQVEPAPAFVLGPARDLLAWNATWERLVRPLGLLDDEQRPNLARFTFLDEPRARTVHPDWEAVADEQVAALRAVSVVLADQPGFTGLVDELLTMPAFAARWSAHVVAERRSTPTRIVHPAVGELRLDVETLTQDGSLDAQRLVVWLAADEATDDRIRRATRPEAGLRAV